MKFKGKDITNADWFGVLAILLIVISGFLFSYYFIISEINSCTSDPLTYAASKEVNENYTHVRLAVYYNKSDFIPIKTIIRDYNVSDQEPD